MKRYAVQVRKDGHYKGQREYATIEEAYRAYDALTNGYPEETTVLLYDRETMEHPAVYRNYHRDKWGNTKEFVPLVVQ